ncbi:MAG: CRISPR-associated endonuclease Cas1 [Anaerolineae bacterium]
MAPVYIREQGAVVRRQGERLVVTRDKERLLDLPLLHVDQVVLFGNVQLTSQAVAMLLQKEVDVVFLSHYGKFRGRLMHTGSKFAQLRHAQLQKLSDEAVNLAVARQVVIGKLHNQRHLLAEQTQREPRNVELPRAVTALGQLAERATRATNADSLRGFEGSAGARYWGAFKTLIPPTLGFNGRQYFPAPDPVNSLLSFGYGLLRKDVTAAVQLVGFDPYLGFFHTIDYGRPSLALDMMEEFRPPLVDWVVLKLIADQQVAPADVERTGNPKQPIRLSEPLMARLIERYEQRVQEKVFHPEAGGETSRRRVIELQVRRLAQLILGRSRQYKPFLMQ